MEEKGLDQYKFALTSGNVSSQEHPSKILVALIYWDKNHEEVFVDEARGGCNCYILDRKSVV